MATIYERGNSYRAEVYVLGVRKNATLDTKAEARSEAIAEPKAKAKPGQRRSAVSEVECIA